MLTRFEPSHAVDRVTEGIERIASRLPKAPVAETLPPPERHCGRCQRAFPGDPGLFFQTDWALCPACESILLPGRPPPNPARTGGAAAPIV